MELTKDHFDIIYSILSFLEKRLDSTGAINTDFFNHATLGISKERFTSYLEMLCDSGFIKGVEITDYLSAVTVDYSNMKITLKGLEYLADSTQMQRAYKTVKKLTDVVHPLV